MRRRVRTERVSTSAGFVGVFCSSVARRQDLRIFLILGASWRLPSVFCNEGTGWYVRKAVRISGKTKAGV